MNALPYIALGLLAAVLGASLLSLCATALGAFMDRQRLDRDAKKRDEARRRWLNDGRSL